MPLNRSTLCFGSLLTDLEKCTRHTDDNDQHSQIRVSVALGLHTDLRVKCGFAGQQRFMGVHRIADI